MTGMAKRQRSGRRSASQAWLITGPLILLATVWAIAIGLVDDQPVGAWGNAALILGVFVAAQVAVFHFVVRRQGYTITINEIPLTLALFYLPTLMVVLVFTLATLMIQLRRRTAPVKTWFNVAKTAASTSLAGLVLLAFPPMEGVGPGTWGILFAAVSTSTLVTLAAVAGVHTLVQGTQAGIEVLRTAGIGLITA
ncbi:MAG TPA: hypothetical protein VFZ87_12475, partial [Gemmatimonadales bacterium]